MKVLYGFPEPLPLDRARGVQTAHAVVELARLGVEVTLVHVPGPTEPLAYYGLARPPRLQLVPLSRSFPWPLRRIHSNRLFAARLLASATAALADAVVLVRHLKLASLLLERRPGSLKLVYEAHEVFADTAPAAKRAARRAEEAHVVKYAAAVIANSGGTADRLKALYGAPRQLFVVPNGVDRPDTVPARDWSHPGRHMVYAGSLFPWKGAQDLVQAAGELPGCRLEIVGGEPARIAQLKQAAAAGGAELLFTGHLPHRQALARIGEACIAVLPNRADADSAFTSPIKLFEYMAAGCAVVASDLPAFREILDGDEAVWVRPGDPASLAEGLRRLASDPERARRLGERLREKSRRFTWAARADKVRSVLEAVA